MSELATPLRNQLAKVIIEARRVAEAGAQKALESLAVERHEPHGSMSPDKRALRNHLRARGRQLGDMRDKQRGSQSIVRLTHEVAYEHWHRMLFARVLAENGLLIHPDHQVAMSLEEIEELAQETGVDPHQMAAGFAQDSLPQIFRTDDPVLEVRLAPETRQKLEALLDSLPTDIFTADDSIGWTYQYWQSEKKDAVNASGEKIGADELPAVTQLFTEHYMVLFLYHNTIGAWHAGKVLAANPSLAETAQSEDELRAAVSLDTTAGKSTFDYLRFVREPQEGDEDDNPTGNWRPAAGTFEGWPKTAEELKVLDPCCGSGHFLIVGFKQLVRLRIHEEGLGIEDAIRAVLSDNIFGLELDPRCTQIAAFNLAIAAWKLVERPIELPPLNIACSGVSIGSSKKDWLALAGDDDRLSAGLENLYELFRKAPELGSLIDPKALKSDLFEAEFGELQPLLEGALARESDNVEDKERAVAAQGMARAADLLDGDYTLAITNVPYLGRGQQNNLLRKFADDYYPTAKADLATMFVERMLQWLSGTGTVAAVTPQSWLFLTSYTKLREKLIKQQTWNLVARLGSKGFQTPMWDFNVMLISLSAETASKKHMITGLDVSEPRTALEKARLLRGESIAGRDDRRTEGKLHVVLQSGQLRNPDAKLTLKAPTEQPLLSSMAFAHKGKTTNDDPQFLRNWWEIGKISGGWCFHLSTTNNAVSWGGREHALLYENACGKMRQLAENQDRDRRRDLQGANAVGRKGVAISAMGSLPPTLYDGETFDTNTSVITLTDDSQLPALWCFCLSTEYRDLVREVDQSLKVTNTSLVKVPFDLDHWQKVAEEKYPEGLPESQSDDPTQWLFHGHPGNVDHASVLQVVVGRLLGYQWPPERDPEMRLAGEAREWVSRCEELKDYADEDGIVCLSATRGEGSAADRVRKLLSAAFGDDWSATKERELLVSAAGDGNKPVASLEIWLRDKFFEEHCKLFQNRPFIWHIWDGNKDGFHCLVNAHKINGPGGEGRRTLEAITYSYLGDWIDRQKAAQQEMVEGADARLAAAQDLQKQLEKILEGESPYDLFVRWKPLHEQAIGWEPDINDGMRLNIRPFMNAKLRKGGKKGADILRWKPNIKWKKDRGKEPQSLRPKEDFPWHWSCNGDGSETDVTDYTADRAAHADFDGNRWNDLHYSRVVKEAARAAAKEKQQETDE